jgi:hypothetical protein
MTQTDCPTCGHRVAVIGDTTRHYEPVGCLQIVDDHELCEREIDQLRRIIRNLHPADAPDPLTARLVRDELGADCLTLLCEVVADA